MATGSVYVAVDLKSFYASAECVARGLDPLCTNLVVADVSRTSKTICLAVSPSLKEYGLGGRARLFEVMEVMSRVNEARRLRAPGRRFAGESCDARELAADPSLCARYIAAMPRMAHYLDVSAHIYGIYLRYASPRDIHVYSVDEVFMDVTHYLSMYGLTPHDLARTIVRQIMRETGITATAGIGSNLYLAKVAMDVVAKHMPADRDGVRVAELDERSYRRLLWNHRPLTDFWRVGRGYARRLEGKGLFTMGDIARCSIGGAGDYYNEELLYRMFGVNAELLIDHAWGWEPCTIDDIKAYAPQAHSASVGQVLTGPADSATALLIAKEMADALALDLTGRGACTNRITLSIGYDSGSLDPRRLDDCVDDALRKQAKKAAREYRGPVGIDHYGRRVPEAAGGSIVLGGYTASADRIRAAVTTVFLRVADPLLLVRRLTVVAGDLSTDARRMAGKRYEQPDLFATSAASDLSCTDSLGADSSGVDCEGVRASPDGRSASRERRSENVQRAMLAVRRRYGRNAVLKAMDMEPGATGIERNQQIGGHRA